MRDSWFGILLALETLLLAAEAALALWLLSLAIVAGGWPLSLWTGGLAEGVAEYGWTELMLGVVLCGGAYWALQLIRLRQWAFRWVAALALAAQVPGIWSQNLLDWQRFFGFGVTFNVEHPPYLVATLLLACLAGLVCLRRIDNLRQLGALLASNNVNREERNRALLNEGAALAGVVVLSLAVAAMLVAAGEIFGSTETLWDRIPLTIITLGGGACLLLVGFVGLFLRGLGRG